jgi:NAD(P)H-quinone oxidoreductase subunit 5
VYYKTLTGVHAIMGVLTYLLILPALLLAALVALPSSWANSQGRVWRRVVTLIAAVQCMVASGFLVAHGAGWIPNIHFVLMSFPGEFPLEITVYYDGVTSLMLALVSFVGWVICGYSVRYLDGEATQGRYYRWTAFTLGAVSLMVISGNLLMFATTWVFTSWGLHKLLLHYGHRPAAQRAAWAKFSVSRIGDAALIGALVSIYVEFNTLDLAELFAAADAATNVSPLLQVAGFLLVVGAATKSAQFPFHTWLPQTLETPTPVSALMHAGIVNAGGYLIIRTSPLVALTPWALTFLVVIGGFTACFAAVVMLTQTSIKKSLAYSTIAQMGFMLMQCGLGAYSAAMLHILAHSLYKAYAFLSSGSVVAEQAVTQGASVANRSMPAIKLIIVGGLLFAVQFIALSLLGVDPITKAGGVLLGAVLCLALTQWIGMVMRAGDPSLFARALGVAGGLIVVYSLCYAGVNKIVAPSLPISSAPELPWLTTLLVALGVLALFSLQLTLATGRASQFLQQWQIHAANGFYLDSWLRRVVRPLVHR